MKSRPIRIRILVKEGRHILFLYHFIPVWLDALPLYGR